MVTPTVVFKYFEDKTFIALSHCTNKEQPCYFQLVFEMVTPTVVFKYFEDKTELGEQTY